MNKKNIIGTGLLICALGMNSMQLSAQEAAAEGQDKAQKAEASQKPEGPQLISVAQAREMALEKNEDIKTSVNDNLRAELNRKNAFKGYLPTLDGSLGAMVMKNIEMQGMGTLKLQGAYMAGLNLTQPIYAGGQIVAGNRMTKIAQKISEQQERKTRMQVIADVDNAYYSLVAVHEKVKMLETYRQMMDTLVEQTKVSVGAQMATNSDLLRVTSQRSNIIYNLQKARNGETLCRLSLCNEIGAEFGTEVIPTDTILKTEAPSGLSEDISQRPELAMLESNIEIQEQTVKKEKSNYLPTVGLSGQLSYCGNIKMEGEGEDADGNAYSYSKTFNQGSWMVMAVASIPIWHWGSEVNKVKAAKLDLEDSKLDLDKNKRLLTIELQQAIQNLTDGYTMIQSAQVAQEQAEENLRQMKTRYDNSYCTLSDLLQVQTDWQEARSNLIEAQTQYKIYETEYKRVNGTLLQ